MNNLSDIFQNYYVFIIAVIVVLAVVIFMFSRNRKYEKSKKRLEEEEIRYNTIKSTPLLFKLNKATAIAKTNESSMKMVETCKKDYEFAHNNLNEISRVLIETQDALQLRRFKEINANLLDIDSLLNLADKQVNDLETKLNVVLEKEAEQRNKITHLKKKYQEQKLVLNQIQPKISFSENALAEFCGEIEKDFSSFEEWMYLAEYNKSNAIINDLGLKVEKLDLLIKQLPGLIEDAKGVIPHLMDELKSDVVFSNQRMVYLGHLETEKNLDVIEDALRTNLQQIQRCDIDEASQSVLDIKERLMQMRAAVRRENDAFTELKAVKKKVEVLKTDISKNYKYVLDMKDTVANKTNGNNYSSLNSDFDKNFNELKTQLLKLDEVKEADEIPNSNMLISYKDMLAELEQLNKMLINDRNYIDNANQDEKHAREQLLKLQLIMNEMYLKIRKHKLPQISDQFELDMVKARTYVSSIKGLLDENPMNLPLITSTVEEAIDFVYSLYNNVNNVVGMALMVENTIVFGNKYRSENDLVDSDLSKAELFYQNGEYTHALTIAIDAIEKIFPNTFEKIIKERVVNE